MKNTLRIAWITVLTAIILIGAVWLLCGWFADSLHSILADSSSPVKHSDSLLANGDAKKLIVIDPGHGGEDPGAIGVDGVLEKDLNLSTALRLRDLLIFQGYQVIMTRSDDRLLFDPNLSASHKLQDLTTRLNYGKLYPTALFVSIHMNKFPDAACKGLQVYYSGNHAESALLADRIQKNYSETFPDAKMRPIKQASSAIFILHRIEIPAVLVECGFLSNPTECELLQNAEYQKKLAALITAALCEPFSQAVP